MSAILSSGQGRSFFGVVEPYLNGVRYNDDRLGFPQVDVYAAGIPTEPTITYAPVHPNIAILPSWCCTLQPEVVKPVETPEPSMVWPLCILFALYGLRLAIASVCAGRRAS